MTADTIDLKERDSTKDSNRLAIDKYKTGGNIYSCEQERAEERTIYKSQNYKQWKYKRRRGHTEPDAGHRSNKGNKHTTYCGTSSSLNKETESDR
eukprot:8529001-Heterocapsa_arctica.AAC.1